MGSNNDSMANRRRRAERNRESSFASSSIYLADQLRRDVSGAWTDNRLEQVNHYRGVIYVAIRALMDAMLSSTIQINKKHRKYHATNLMLLERGEYEDDFSPTAVQKSLPGASDHREGEQHRPFDDPDHSLVKLIDIPNRTETFNELLAQLVMQYQLTGSGLLWANPNSLGVPGELYVLPTALCYAQPPTSDYPEGWWRVAQYYPSGGYGMLPSPISGGGVPVDARDVLVFKNPHPLFRWDAMSPLTAGGIQLDILEAIDQARWTAMDQGLTPDMVLMAPGVNQAQLDTYLERLKHTNIGKRNHRKVMAIGGDQGDSKFDVKWPSNTAKDMDFSGGWDQMTAFALSLFGVPKAVAGLSTTGSYAELYAALKQFHTNSLKPLVARMGVWLTRHLAWIWSPRTRDLSIQIDLPTIDDQQLQESQLSTDLAHDGLTYNEYRAIRGRKPVPGGDVLVSVYVADQQQKAQAKAQAQQQAMQPQTAALGQDAGAGGQAAPSSPNVPPSGGLGGGGEGQAPDQQQQPAGDPLSQLLGTQDDGAPPQQATGDDAHVQNSVTDAALAALGVPAQGGPVQKGYEPNHLKARAPNPKTGVPKTPGNPVKQPIASPPNQRSATASSSDNQTRAELDNREPGERYPAPVTGKPRQQTASDTSAPAPAPKPAPNPAADAAPTAPLKPTKPGYAAPPVPAPGGQVAPKPQASAPETQPAPAKDRAPAAPPPEPQVASATIPAGVANPGPIQHRKEGEVWRGPSGHTFTLKNGRPVPAPGQPQLAEIPPRPQAQPLESPTIGNRRFQGRTVPPIEQGIVRGFPHGAYSDQEMAAVLEKMRGASPFLRLPLPPDEIGRRGDTMDIATPADLRKFVEAGGRFPGVVRGRLRPDNAVATKVTALGERAVGVPLSVSDMIDRGSHNDLSPDQLGAAAAAVAGKDGYVRLSLPNGSVVAVRNGLDLKKFLDAGGRLPKRERDRLELAVGQTPAQGQTPAPAPGSAENPLPVPGTPDAPLDLPRPVARPVVTREEVQNAVRTGQPIPPQQFAPAAKSVVASTPQAQNVLANVQQWAGNQAERHVDAVAQHFMISPAKAHELLTNAMVAVAQHAAAQTNAGQSPAGVTATIRNQNTGQTASVKYHPRTIAARQIVNDLADHLRGGHDLTAQQAAEMSHALDHLPPDEVKRVANSLATNTTRADARDTEALIRLAKKATAGVTAAATGAGTALADATAAAPGNVQPLPQSPPAIVAPAPTRPGADPLTPPVTSAQAAATKFATTRQADQWAKKNFGDWAKSVTPDEDWAINAYTGGGFQEINDSLREGTAPEKTRGKTPKVIEHLDRVMSRTAAPEPMTVYRGVGGDYAKKLIDAAKKGETVTDPTYLSTSLHEGTAKRTATTKGGADGEKVVVHIDVPKGSPGLAPGAIDAGLHEAEWLMPRGTSLKLSGAERGPDGTWIVRASPASQPSSPNEIPDLPPVPANFKPGDKLHPSFEVSKGLSPEDAWHEQYSQQYARQNYDRIKAAYLKENATPDDQGGHSSVVLNTDEFRHHLPGYIGTNAHAVHEASSFLNKKLYADALASQRGKGNNKFLVLAGGGGSGKGTLTKSFFNQSQTPLTLDQVSGQLPKLEKALDEAKANGYEPTYAFVDRDPENAVANGVVPRAVNLAKKGQLPRTVPIERALHDNLAAREVALQLIQKRPDIKPHIMTMQDGKPRLIVDRNEAVQYLTQKVAEAKQAVDGGLREKIAKDIAARTAAGEIPENIAHGLIGKDELSRLAYTTPGVENGRPDVSRSEQVPAVDAAGARPVPAANAGLDDARPTGGEAKSQPAGAQSSGRDSAQNRPLEAVASKVDEAKSYLQRLETQAQNLRSRGRQSSALNRQVAEARRQVELLESGQLKAPSVDDLEARANRIISERSKSRPGG
jgi:hypothetical protein